MTWTRERRGWRRRGGLEMYLGICRGERGDAGRRSFGDDSGSQGRDVGRRVESGRGTDSTTYIRLQPPSLPAPLLISTSQFPSDGPRDRVAELAAFFGRVRTYVTVCSLGNLCDTDRNSDANFRERRVSGWCLKFSATNIGNGYSHRSCYKRKLYRA